MVNPKNGTSETEIRRIDQFLRVARERRVVEPGGELEGMPVALRRLKFPAVSECLLLGFTDLDAKRISGQQRLERVAFREVDFSESRLDFSIWSVCSFQNVRFDRVSLQNCRFFGCRFTRCSFLGSDLTDASFAPESDGAECVFSECCFEKTRIQGTQWSSPSFCDTGFINCRFRKTEFDGAAFQSTRFVGRYEELNFRGQPGSGERNRLDIDLTGADLTWLHANYGVDLTGLRLSHDRHALVIVDRQRSIPILSKELKARRPEAHGVADVLIALFTDESISPLSNLQETVFLSARVLREFDESLTEEQSNQVLETIREVARAKGFAHSDSL